MVNTMKYQAIFERAEDGTIWGYIPDVPGATGAGDSIEAAKKSLREGLRIWIELANERGDAIPEPSTVLVETIEVTAA